MPLSVSSDATRGVTIVGAGFSSSIGEPPEVVAWVLEEEAMTGSKGREKRRKKRRKRKKKENRKKEEELP